MKKSLLLTATLCAAFAVNAQDVTPTNWQFANMKVGSAESIFLKDLATTTGNPNKTATVNQVTNAGGVALTCWYEGGTENAADIAADTKALYEEFYKGASIVNGGTENLLCIMSNAAAEELRYPDAGSCPSSLPLTMLWLTGKNLDLDSYYRFTVEYKILSNREGSIQLQIDAIDGYGIENSAPITVNMPVYTQEQIGQLGISGWFQIPIDFYVENTGDPATNTLPLKFKMNCNDQMGWTFDYTMLFRSFKLEKITEEEMKYTSRGNVTPIPSDFKDDPNVSVNEINAQNDVIIATANGTINVIDANAPIEVYNIAGAKVATVAAPSAVEAIDLDMNGVFVVKVGDKVQKVIL